MLKTDTISKCALFYLIVWCLSPPLSYGTIYRVAAFGAMAYIFVNLSSHINKSFAINIFLIAYIFVLSKVTGDSMSSRISVYIILCMILCSQQIYELKDIKNTYNVIVVMTFALCILWNYTSMRGIAEVPNIMRLLAKNSSISAEYAKMGVGGYGYIYTILALLPFGIDFVLNSLNRWYYRCVALIYVISTYILIFNAQYFMAIILSLLIIPVYFITKCQNKSLKMFLLVLVFLIFIIIYLNADNILLSLADMTDIRSIKEKILSTYDILSNNEDIEGSEFSTRYKRYTMALTQVVSHPIRGGLSYSKTGNHSHIFDFFAQYGIPVGITYLYCLYKPFCMIKMKTFSAGFTVIVVIVLIALFNIIPFSLGIVLYIILPLYYLATRGRSNE